MSAKLLIRREWFWIAQLVLVLLVAAFLRLETIDQRVLWFDETVTYDLINKDHIGQVLRIGSKDNYAHPPLHHVLAYFATGIHDSVAFFRMPSVVCGVLCVVGTLCLGSVLFSRRVGMVAAFLMTVSIYHINYSQDARPYMLLLMLTVGQYLCFFSYVLHERVSRLVLFVLFGVGALYTSHLAVIDQVSLLLISFTLFVMRKQARDSLRRIGWAYVVIGLLYLPQLPNFLSYVTGSGTTEERTLRLSLRFFHELFARWGSGTGWIAFLYDVLFILGVVYTTLSGLWKTGRNRNLQLGLLVWFLVPFVLFAVVPFSKFFNIRYVICSMPIFILCVAAGIDWIASLMGAVASWFKAGQQVISFVRPAVLVVILATIGVVAAKNYLVFRQIDIRCSEFFRNDRVLGMHDGFCEKHIILDTINPNHRFMISRSEPEQN